MRIEITLLVSRYIPAGARFKRSQLAHKLTRFGRHDHISQTPCRKVGKPTATVSAQLTKSESVCISALFSGPLLRHALQQVGTCHVRSHQITPIVAMALFNLVRLFERRSVGRPKMLLKGQDNPTTWHHSTLQIRREAIIRTLSQVQSLVSHKMHRLSILYMLWATMQVAQSTETLVVPNEIQTGASVAQFVSGTSGLDGPKVQPNNATSFDWWYFDAVSEDSLSSVVIVFYLSTDLGFPFLLPLSAISVDIFVSFDDGTLLFFPLNDLPSTDGEAIVVTDGDGSSGYWKSTGFQWTGTSNMSQYVVTIDSPVLGITGSLTLNSVCTAGSNFLIHPYPTPLPTCILLLTGIEMFRLPRHTIHAAQLRLAQILKCPRMLVGQMQCLIQTPLRIFLSTAGRSNSKGQAITTR